MLISRITVFRSDIEDLIEWREVDPNPLYDKWRPVNVGKAFNKGIEAELSSDLYGRIRQKLAYTRLESKGKSEGETAYHTLQYTAPHQVDYNAAYYFPFGMDISASLKWVDLVKWKDQYGVKHRLERYTVVGSRISQKVDSIELFFAVDNIFDERYLSREGYPLPGTIYRGGINVSF